MIHIQAKIQAPLAAVWDAYNDPEDIKQWNQASPEWHCPSSENDLRPGGRFKNRMEARDGSLGFNFEGVYTEVLPMQSIKYKLADNRDVAIRFSEAGNATLMDIGFEAETTNPVDMQQQGWQAILDSFKNHVENKWT